MTVFGFLRSTSCRIALSAVMAVQVVNMSIDAVDPSPYYEDLSINEIESCVEFVLEVMLGHSNAIEETDDQDHHSQKTGSTLLFISHSPTINWIQDSFLIVRERSGFSNHETFESLIQSVTSPPPKSSFLKS